MEDVIEQVSIADIVISDRCRKDLGDLRPLAESIGRVGLLQPIGITPNLHLIFGARRIEACKLRGWDRIPVRVLNIKSIVLGEHDEKDIRKDLTASEKVAIAQAIEDELAGRWGRPRTRMVGLSPPFPRGKTRDLTAQKAGFGSGKQYERAKTIVEYGAPELVAAVDAGKVAIKPAAEFAKQDPQKQTEQIKESGGNIVNAVKRFRESLPTKHEARKIAAESPVGTAVLGKDGRWHTNTTNEQRARADLYLRLADALRNLRDLDAAPEQIVDAVPKQSKAVFGPLVDQAADTVLAIRTVWRSRHAA
jgi:hypothetical protein